MTMIEELSGLLLSFLGGKYSLKPREIPGYLGDGTTTLRVEVAPSSDRVYFRPTPYENEIWQVIHRESSIPLWHGFPVYVRWEPIEKEWIVTRTDWTGLARQEDMALRYVAQHAIQHIINEDSIPDDPIWIYRRAIVALRGGPAGDASFRLEVKTGPLPWASLDWFEGGYGPDLTSYVPATAGQERWVSHYIDEDGAVQASVEVGTHDPDHRAIYPHPAIPLGSVPIANCIIAYGDTILEEDSSIWDARIICAPITISQSDLNKHMAILEAEFDLALSMHVVEG